MVRKYLATAAVVAAFAAGQANAETNWKPLEGDPTEINFGIISTESSQTLKDQWLPLLADMEKGLGMKINAFFAPDYAGIIEGMRFGKVHVAWFGNKSAIEAVDRAGAEVFAQQSKVDGNPGYYSHLITNVDNKNINTLDDVLKCDGTMDFGIGDPNSTSGFLVPTYYVFAQNAVDPKKCFKTVRNANHETNLMAVANKQVDVATNNSEQIQRTIAKAPEAAAKLKVVWTSPLIPNDPLVYRKDLSRELKSKIKGFLLAYGRIGPDVAREKAVLAKISDGLGPFLESSNTQLYPIRQLNLYKDMLKIQNSEGLDDKEKIEKSAGIQKELDDLKVLVAHQ